MPFGAPVQEPSKSGYDEAWVAVTRAARINYLAKPTLRQMTPYPNPLLVKDDPLRITQSSLVYVPSRRIKLLGRFNPRFFTPKFQKSMKQEHYVHPDALVFVPSPRILQLSKRKKVLVSRKKSLRKREMRRIKRAKKFRENRNEWLALRAVPKKPPKPPALTKPKKKMKSTPEERSVRLKELAKPRPKPRSNVKNPYYISKAALNFDASNRLTEIAMPKELNEETILDLLYDPYKIKYTALTYVASERLKELAVPNIRKQAVDTDVKENPFSILPRALTAICTKRTKELARPVMRS